MAETRIKLEDLKPNSHKSKEENPEKPQGEKSEKAIKGDAIIRKTFAGKFAEAFFDGADLETAYKYALKEVMFPAIRRAIVSTGQSILEMIFLGGASVNRDSRRRGREEHVSYDSYYKSDVRGHSRDDSNDRYIGNDYRNIVVSSRGKAQEVIDTLTDIIDDGGEATVSDLYEAAGITQEQGDVTIHRYGWDNLSSAKPRLTPDGWLIAVPKAKPLPKDFE